ncbi:MAG: hypothetical protein PHN42_00610 [Bacilli bacterium]|nr:hypothetical protein [Bacilli bacterium]
MEEKTIINEGNIFSEVNNDLPVLAESKLDQEHIEKVQSDLNPGAILSKEEKKETTGTVGFDNLFNNLYNDVAGANDFISNLIEQRKTISVSEANLNEQRAKLEKEKEEFEKYCDVQKDNFKQEKQRLDEYEKTQKIRLQNEESSFAAEVEATKNEISLAQKGLKISEETLNEEKRQFEKYKETEEERILLAKAQFEEEKVQYNKERNAEIEQIRLAKENLEVEKASFSKEKENALKLIKEGQEGLESLKQQFEKYKENEEKKLELESKNLSQSCARFKELVSQFNSGFELISDK